jgi:hypothetical protein
MSCQLKIILFLGLVLFGACSSNKNDEKDLNTESTFWGTNLVKPRWFSEDKNFSLHDREGKLYPHLFFDTDPSPNFEDKTINFIVVTPAKSQVAYDFDLVTGKRFGRYLYCRQKDVWESYRSWIENPPYTEGLIPKMLDQLGKPQKVYVFGHEDYYASSSLEASHQVKVVGAVVEQICHEGSCIGKNNWESRLVLIAVDQHDEEMKEVNSIEALKEVVDWNKAKAFMQNGQGRNQFGEKDAPAIRITGEIKPGFAMKFAMSFSHTFNNEELSKIRTSCTKLYNYAWTKFGKLKSNEKEAMSVEDLKLKLRQKEKNKFAEKISSFDTEFKDFHKNYGIEFLTCSDIVAYQSLAEDKERHWFFALLTGFYRLERLGHVFNCKQKLWQLNPFIPNTNKREKDSTKSISECTDEDLDVAFSQISNYMNSLKQSGREYFRYVEYDNSSFGTHQKFYSWVNVTHKKLGCEDQKLVQKMYDFEVFPSDIHWVNRSAISEKKRFGIIY